MVRSIHAKDVEIEGEIKAKAPSGKAILFYDGKVEVWLPMSQIEVADDEMSVLVPVWLAMEKGLI